MVSAWSVRKGSNIAGVDPRLADILSHAAQAYYNETGNTVEGISGRKARKSGTQWHPTGRAIDVEITDPEKGKLGNYRNAKTFRQYERFAQYARQYQQEHYPELDDSFNFGGWFGGRYAFDQMHFDIGPLRTKMGNWITGLTKAGRRALGISDYSFPAAPAPTGPATGPWGQEPPSYVGPWGNPGSLTPVSAAEAAQPVGGLGASVARNNAALADAYQSMGRSLASQGYQGVGGGIAPAAASAPIASMPSLGGGPQPTALSRAFERGFADTTLGNMMTGSNMPVGPEAYSVAEAGAAPKAGRVTASQAMPSLDRFGPTQEQQAAASVPGGIFTPAGGYASVTAPQKAPPESVSPDVASAPVSNPDVATADPLASTAGIGLGINTPFTPDDAYASVTGVPEEQQPPAVREATTRARKAAAPAPDQTVSTRSTTAGAPNLTATGPWGAALSAPGSLPGSFPSAPTTGLGGFLNQLANPLATLGNPLGGLGALVSGLSNFAGPTPSPQKYNYGSGLKAISDILGGGGAPGATAYSRSTPGYSVTNLGNGFVEKTNQYGVKSYEWSGFPTTMEKAQPFGGLFGRAQSALGGGMFGGWGGGSSGGGFGGFGGSAGFGGSGRGNMSAGSGGLSHSTRY